MKILKYISASLLLVALSVFAAGKSSSEKSTYTFSKLTTEPALGINPMPTSDLVISNLGQYNIKKRLSVVSYSAYTRNSAFLRDFNHIHTDYNFSLSQKFGVGTSLYSKHSSHTFSFMAGIKYNTFKETLKNPELKEVSASMKSTTPDFGLLYSLKKGEKKYFFSFRMYIPLYPYPFKTADVNAADANLANLSLEFGIGIRLK